MPPDPVLRIVDAESGGDVSRVIIDGVPPLRGTGIAGQRDDFAARYDHLRWKLIQPPHGELHMCPVLLLKTPEEDADFGIIIMESMGYPPISGSNLFCAAAVALETGVASMREPETRLQVATPAGVVTVSAFCRDGRCHSAAFENTPAHVRSSMEMDGSPPFRVTIVSAGVDYAVVDATVLDLATTDPMVLVEHGQRIAGLAGTDFVLFHDRLKSNAGTVECRVAVFQNPSVICRSPTGTGTSALLTLAFARGLIEAGGTLAARSPSGSVFRGRIVGGSDSARGAVLRTVVTGDVRTGAAFSIH